MSFFSTVSGTLHSQDRFRLSLSIYQDNAALSYTPGGASVVHCGADDVSQITGGEYGGGGAIINVNQDVNFMNCADQEVDLLESPTKIAVITANISYMHSISIPLYT